MAETWETVLRGHGWRQRAGVGAALVTVVTGLWALGAVGAGDDPPAPSLPVPTQPGFDPGPTVAAASTPAASGDAPTPAGEPPAADRTGGREPVRSGQSREPLIAQPEGPGVTAVVGDGSPLLGRPTGLSVFVGTPLSLRRLDLDTATVTWYDVPAVPTLAADGWLVVTRPNGTLRAVRVDDPEAGSQILPWPGQRDAAVLPGPDDDQLWLFDVSGPAPRWTLVRVSDGVVLERHQAPEPAWATSGGALDPTLTGSPAGGVYLRTDDRYRQVAAGQLLAVSQPYVLVRHCDRSFACRLAWLARPGFDSADRALPDEARAGALEAAWLTADGRMLSYATASGAELFDVERGEVVLEIDEPGEVMASPNGRYVAAVARERLHVYDTETGVDHLIDVALPFGARILLVDDATER